MGAQVGHGGGAVELLKERLGWRSASVEARGAKERGFTLLHSAATSDDLEATTELLRLSGEHKHGQVHSWFAAHRA